MSADRVSPSASGHPHPRLVTTSEAAVLLGVDEGTLWRMIDRAGLRVHAWRESEVAIQVTDVLYLRAQAKSAPGPRLVQKQDHFDIELLAAQHANAKERLEQLEIKHREHLEQLDDLVERLEEERENRIERELLRAELAKATKSLEEGAKRLESLEVDLNEAQAEHDKRVDELSAARDRERAALCTERSDLIDRLTAATDELEDLRRAVLAGRAEREALRAELEVTARLERSTQRYADKLEEKLNSKRA